MSANKKSKELHTAVSVAFSFLFQCTVKTGGKLLLFIDFQQMQQKEEVLRARPIGNYNKEMILKSEKKLEESGEITSNERFPSLISNSRTKLKTTV